MYLIFRILVSYQFHFMHSYQFREWKNESFEKGDISESIMASSAFPSLMDPVKLETVST